MTVAASVMGTMSPRRIRIGRPAAANENNSGCQRASLSYLAFNLAKRETLAVPLTFALTVALAFVLVLAFVPALAFVLTVALTFVRAPHSHSLAAGCLLTQLRARCVQKA